MEYMLIFGRLNAFLYEYDIDYILAVSRLINCRPLEHIKNFGQFSPIIQWMKNDLSTE